MAIASSMTTGRFSTVPTPRMATCGWLMIGIRTMGYLTLGYDHRLVDGAAADQYMADLKRALENFDPAQV